MTDLKIVRLPVNNKAKQHSDDCIAWASRQIEGLKTEPDMVSGVSIAITFADGNIATCYFGYNSKILLLGAIDDLHHRILHEWPIPEDEIK